MPTMVGALKELTGTKATRSRTGSITVSQATEKARNHPFVLVGSGIAGTGTNYVGHHAILILEIDDDGMACIVDLDDTVKGKADGDIIRIESIEELLKGVRPDSVRLADFDGNADEPRESIVEPRAEGSGTCVIL